MPDTASTADTGSAGTASQPASRREPARSRGGRKADQPPLQTLAQAMGARDYQPRGDVDDERMTRSFHLRVGVIERARAASVGVEHKAYGTDIEGDVPNSFSAFVEEAIVAACTYYENLFNNGNEFRRTGPLAPGPTREGAQRGAAKRKRAREPVAPAGG
jgi:hypothetical protein